LQAPDSQHFVRGSADLHIFTVRTKLVIFQSITLPENRNKDHEPKWWCECVCGWVRDFQFPTFNFQILISDPFLSMTTTTGKGETKKNHKKCILHTFSPEFVVISLLSLNSEPSFLGEVSFLYWKIIRNE
jgi:hypothetical protein